jgi:MoxR-like ATPase
MEEHQVTIAEETLALPDPFFVMATQNPIDLEGTYPLPEAQIDRFLLKLVVPYPSREEESEIVARDAESTVAVEAVIDADGVKALREAAAQVHVAPEVRDYAVRIVRATREPERLAEHLRDAKARGAAVPSTTALLGNSPVVLGASPRASIYLVRAARARSLLDGRHYATPHDVKLIAPDVLRHRVVVSYEAEADGVTPIAVVEALLASVETP